MAKANPPRTMGVEDLIAKRVAELRRSSVPAMSYETLATRMAAVGCPSHPSALHRIETGSPRRKVSVDELVALAQVFDMSVDSLIAPEATGVVAEVEADLLGFREANTSLLKARDQLRASELEVHLAEQVVAERLENLSGWRKQLNDHARGSVTLDVTPDEAVALEALRKELLRPIYSSSPRKLKTPSTKGWS